MLAGGSKVKGGDKIVKKLRKATDKENILHVGFFPGSTYPDGTPVAYVAAINNYGTQDSGGFIPAAPFFSNVVRERQKNWAKGIGYQFVHNGYNLEDAVRTAGEAIRSDIVKSINDTTEPPNAESTIRQSKNKNKKRLIDTSTMIRAVGVSYNGESPQLSKKRD